MDRGPASAVLPGNAARRLGAARATAIDDKVAAKPPGNNHPCLHAVVACGAARSEGYDALSQIAARCTFGRHRVLAPRRGRPAGGGRQHTRHVLQATQRCRYRLKGNCRVGIFLTQRAMSELPASHRPRLCWRDDVGRAQAAKPPCPRGSNKQIRAGSPRVREGRQQRSYASWGPVVGGGQRVSSGAGA
jgi:hypothetical protein